MEYTTVSTQKNNLVVDLDGFLELLYKVETILDESTLDEQYKEIQQLKEEIKMVIDVLESSDGEFNKASKLVMKLAFYINSVFNK